MNEYEPTDLLICEECFAILTDECEMLPDYPGLYQCPECGHPNGPF